MKPNLCLSCSTQGPTPSPAQGVGEEAQKTPSIPAQGASDVLEEREGIRKSGNASWQQNINETPAALEQAQPGLATSWVNTHGHVVLVKLYLIVPHLQKFTCWLLALLLHLLDQGVQVRDLLRQVGDVFFLYFFYGPLQLR